jgi:hypothetical protein
MEPATALIRLLISSRSEAEMYEFHGWCGLAETTEEADTGHLQQRIEELQGFLQPLKWPTSMVELVQLNGEYFLTITGLANRRRQEGAQIDRLLTFISRHIEGSWGLLYERDDAMSAPPGPNAYRVRVLARGRITERLDPFLSPCRPTIED